MISIKGALLLRRHIFNIKNRKRVTEQRQGLYLVYAHPLPSSVWVSHGHVASPTTAPSNPTWMGWRRTSAGAHFIIVAAGRRRRSSPSSAGGHSVIPTIAAAGPASSHGEASHESSATTPLLKHHGKTTIFIRFIIEVGVIGLCTAFYGCLKNEGSERCFDLLRKKM